MQRLFWSKTLELDLLTTQSGCRKLVSFQLKPSIPGRKAFAFPVLASTDEAWLNGLLITLASGRVPVEHIEEVRRRLKNTPFDMILSAIERAGQDLSCSAEVALYEQWIEANDGVSLVLYAAWFNIGVSFTRAGKQVNAAIAYSNALALRPDMHLAAINLGLLLEAKVSQNRRLQPGSARHKRTKCARPWKSNRGVCLRNSVVSKTLKKFFGECL